MLAQHYLDALEAVPGDDVPELKERAIGPARTGPRRGHLRWDPSGRPAAPPHERAAPRHRTGRPGPAEVRPGHGADPRGLGGLRGGARRRGDPDLRRARRRDRRRHRRRRARPQPRRARRQRGWARPRRAALGGAQGPPGRRRGPAGARQGGQQLSSQAGRRRRRHRPRVAQGRRTNGLGRGDRRGARGPRHRLQHGWAALCCHAADAGRCRPGQGAAPPDGAGPGARQPDRDADARGRGPGRGLRPGGGPGRVEGGWPDLGPVCPGEPGAGPAGAGRVDRGWKPPACRRAPRASLSPTRPTSRSAPSSSRPAARGGR